ncbi:hypothetical protein J1N35_012179 [Gossypium stocksii]|uniref:Uncharacterized protein n=1 Tax=Gossypium stocksii TaxID=47602 RepID=A0A9D3W429_9ROSI|nr:hypothetical protein J1N35_012179 [Gossypium stocksii]
MIPEGVLYRCSDFDWVPLLGIWGAVGYAPLLVLRQYQLRAREISNAWNQTYKLKGLATNSLTTPDYDQWRGQRINDNIPITNQENALPLEEHLRVIPSELEIIKRDFEKKSIEFGKKIEQLKEEKMKLVLDVDIHRLEAEKLKNGKNKAEEDLNGQRTYYQKLSTSMRTAGLEKTSEQWRREVRREKSKVVEGEKKLQDAQTQEVALRKSLLENQDEKEKLRARVTDLEKSLRHYWSRNSLVELKASLNRIEGLEKNIVELETVLQNSKTRVGILEANNEH